MLICKDCGRIEDNARWHETCSQMSLLGTDKLICPDCGSDQITPAHQCAHCHKWVSEDELVMTPGKDNIIEVCVDCYEEHYFVEPGGEPLE